MKRNSLRLLFIFLSIFGVASLVGTGFAVFVFIEEGTEVSAKEASVGLSIEPVAISGEFRIEQAPSKLVLSEGNKTSNDLFEGINFYTSKYDEKGDEYSGLIYKWIICFVIRHGWKQSANDIFHFRILRYPVLIPLYFMELFVNAGL